MSTKILICLTFGLVIGLMSVEFYTSSSRNSYTFIQWYRYSKLSKPVSGKDILNLMAKIAENEHLNKIFSEVVGVNITTLDIEIMDFVETSIAEISNIRNDEQIMTILQTTNLSFQMNIVAFCQRFLERLLNFISGYEDLWKLTSNSAPNLAFNKLCWRLINLVKRCHVRKCHVKKEDVLEIFDSFMNTEWKDNIRSSFRSFKFLMGIYFIVDEAIETVMDLVEKEEPAIQSDFKAMLKKLEETWKAMIKPVIDLLKPAILPEYKYKTPALLVPATNIDALDHLDNLKIDIHKLLWPE